MSFLEANCTENESVKIKINYVSLQLTTKSIWSSDLTSEHYEKKGQGMI